MVSVPAAPIRAAAAARGARNLKLESFILIGP
jgi:hypothetical protein